MSIAFITSSLLYSKALAEVIELQPHVNAATQILIIDEPSHDQVMALQQKFVRIIGLGGDSLEGVITLSKPFRLSALLALLFQEKHYRFGPFVFTPHDRILSIDSVDTSDGQRNLTEKESQILEYLCQHGEASAQSLCAALWEHDAESHTLESHIYRLRQKLSLPNTPPVLQTTPQGYKIDAS